MPIGSYLERTPDYGRLLEKQARITSKGQITVPREVRRVLGVRPGDRLLFESDENGVRVRPAVSMARSITGVWIRYSLK